MVDINNATDAETPADFGKTPAGMVRRWLVELNRAKKQDKWWHEQVERVMGVYWVGKSSPSERSIRSRRAKFNVLFSITQTIIAAVYAHQPRPDVRRRFKDPDIVARKASVIIERALGYSIDAYDFETEFEGALLDHSLTGRGVNRVRYLPTFVPIRPRVPVGHLPPENVGPDPITGALPEHIPHRLDTMDPVEDPSTVQTDGEFHYVEGDPEDKLDYEEVQCEHVAWDDFRCSPARSWSLVRWVAFRGRMTRDELREKYERDIADAVSLSNYGDLAEDAPDQDKAATNEVFQQAEVWEIWDKETKKVYHICAGYTDGPLLVEDDPYQLNGFFPCPRPMCAVRIPGTVVPYPEYLVYEDQARELNEVTRRIEALTKALKVRGIYDATQPELDKLLKADDNEMVPMENFMAMAQAGGMEKAVQFFPIEVIIAVLRQLYSNRESIKQVIYEVTGISDILRGASDPGDTATAQNIKAKFGGLRLNKRQREVQRYVRDLFRMKAEIIAEKFQATTLSEMTGEQVDDQIINLLRSNSMRGFRIDVETDSMIATDTSEDQKAVTDLLGGITTFISGIAPYTSVPSNPKGVIPIEAVKSLLLTAVRRFRLGNEVEDAINMIGEGMQPQTPPPPSGEQPSVGSVLPPNPSAAPLPPA